MIRMQHHRCHSSSIWKWMLGVGVRGMLVPSTQCFGTGHTVHCPTLASTCVAELRNTQQTEQFLFGSGGHASSPVVQVNSNKALLESRLVFCPFNSHGNMVHRLHKANKASFYQHAVNSWDIILRYTEGEFGSIGKSE